MGFPLGAPPAHYTTCTFPTKRCGIFTVGDIVQVTLSQITATSYEVRDYWGDIVSTGTVASATLTPTVPAGGWKPGWYRLHLLGAITNDPDYGRSYGATSFVVIRSDARFPTLPAPAATSSNSSTLLDLPTAAIMGFGASVLTIDDAANPNAGGQLDAVMDDLAIIDDYWRDPLHATYADPDRPARQAIVSFPNGAVDYLAVPGASGGSWIHVYVAPGVNGATTYVRVTAGTSSGYRIRVYSPNAASLVEDMDNLAADPVAASASARALSAYVRPFSARDAATPAAMGSPLAIGGSKLAGVTTAVTALAGIADAFQGPDAVDADDPATAYEAYLFRLAVKAGDFDALVAGPAPVSLPVDVPTGFFAEFGGDWCDLISSAETDSMPGGNLPLGRHALGRYVTALHHYGVDLKDRWRTGSSGEPIPNGVLHPRRARVRLLHALLWEQHGVPRERNQDAVDRNDGTVWDDRAWWQAEDGTCLPDVALWRTLAMETFGMAYAEPLSFGPIGDAVFLGSVYRGPAGAVVVLVAGSHIDGATVTLNVNTTGTLTISNAFGATISATVLDGRVTVEVGDVPTYVRIPAAATVSVYRCNDWPPAAQAQAWLSQSNRATATVSGVPAQTAANGGWMTSYNDGTGAYREDRPVPALLFDSDRTGNFEIYSTVAGKVTRITSDPTYDSWWPRCSPDGTKVLFTRSPAGLHDTDYTQISTWVCNIDGSGLVNILPLGVDSWALQGHPSWSPDGTKIVTMGGAVDLYTCNPDGTGRAKLTTTGQSFGLSDPAYSPDGTKILYVYSGQVYWVPAAGGTPTAVTANAWTNYDPVLSPDGTTVAYLSHMSANPVADWAVRLIDLAGTNDRACIADGAINSRPEWSDDGERIFFHRNPPANGESGVFSLYAINPDGSGLTPVFTGPTGTAEYPVIVHPVDGEPFANITLTFPSTIRCDRVIVWAGPAHATWSTLLDFDVQVSVDHAATWTTKATFTSSPTSIAHGSDDTGFGTTRETWWDEQWIFDVPFPAGPVDCNALRLNIRQVSYGGEPDLECLDGIGEGVATRLVSIQEVAVLCDAAASRTPQLV